MHQADRAAISNTPLRRYHRPRSRGEQGSGESLDAFSCYRYPACGTAGGKHDQLCLEMEAREVGGDRKPSSPPPGASVSAVRASELSSISAWVARWMTRQPSSGG